MCVCLCIYIYIYIYMKYIIYFHFWPHPRHTEFSDQGSDLALSCNPSPQLQQCPILNLLCRARNRTCILVLPRCYRFHFTTVGTPHLSFFFFFFVFLSFQDCPHGIWRSPGWGVQSELQLPASVRATAMQDLSHICNLHHNAGSLTH